MSRGFGVKPSPIPADLARERGQLLNKALRDLPLELLEALLRGVRRHGDALAPGALHSGRGGCAVGMMLHELRGTKPGRRFRWRSPTIHEDAPELARRYPRLGHLELMFDRTCEELAGRRGVEPCDVACEVGLWMAAEVQTEMDNRRSPLYVPAEWQADLERVPEPV
jgi:hypothetical protein